MKLINATFEAENQLAEIQLWNKLESIGGKYLKVLPNVDHLKEDSHFVKLQKDVKKSKDNLYNYINKNRI